MQESIPPSIADLQSQGVPGIWSTCCNPMCLRSTPLAFAAIGLTPETPFPVIAGTRRFVCAACGSRRAKMSPDWRGHRAAGFSAKTALINVRREGAGDANVVSSARMRRRGSLPDIRKTTRATRSASPPPAAPLRGKARPECRRRDLAHLSRAQRPQILKVERKQDAVPGGCRRAQEHFIRSEACEGCALLGRNHHRRLLHSICSRTAFLPHHGRALNCEIYVARREQLDVPCDAEFCG